MYKNNLVYFRGCQLTVVSLAHAQHKQNYTFNYFFFLNNNPIVK